MNEEFVEYEGIRRSVKIPPRPPLPNATNTHSFNALLEEDLSHLTDYELMTKGLIPFGLSMNGEIYLFRRHVREVITRLFMPMPKFISREDLDELEDKENKSAEELVRLRELRKKYRKQQLRIQKKRKSHPGWPSVNKYGPPQYSFWVYGGIASFVLSTMIGLSTPERLLLMLGGWVITILMLIYPVSRELNRWIKRKVLLRDTEAGLRVTYGEPNNAFFKFKGDNDGFTETIEGSNQIGKYRSWVDKLVFWGCYDVHIGSKIEGNDTPRLENVPHAKDVQSFVNKSV